MLLLHLLKYENYSVTEPFHWKVSVVVSMGMASDKNSEVFEACATGVLGFDPAQAVAIVYPIWLWEHLSVPKKSWRTWTTIILIPASPAG